MIIDCIGCLHGARPKLEGGDLLIVTGDLTARDEPEQYLAFNEWLKNQNYKRKIVIAGNHDNCLQSGVTVFVNPLLANSYIPLYGIDVNYLCDSGTEFEGLKIWGSPWTKTFKRMNPNCKAFTVETEKELAEKWALIPDDMDILITHSPPYGILDGIPMEDGSLFHVGSKSLYGRLKYAIRPHLHVFSHIHEAYGQIEHFPTYNDKMMISINCSIMNKLYKPVNVPIRIIL